MSQELCVLILAAGKGTRMKSATSKVLHPIAGVPLIGHVVRQAKQLNTSHIVTIVGHQAESVQAYLQRDFKNIRFAVQGEQKGTGHAIQCAIPEIPSTCDTVLILSGDVPLMTSDVLHALITARATQNAPLALMTTVTQNPKGYGRIIRNSAGLVTHIIEEKDATDEQRSITEVNAGIYCVDRLFLESALKTLTPKNAQGEYYLTDIVLSASHIASIQAPFALTAGINDRSELALAEADLRHRINLKHMLSGVSLRDPKTTYIDADVVIGMDTEVAAGSFLQGKTVIGSNVRIGHNTTIIDCTIDDHCEIKPYSHLQNAILKAHCIIGPFSRLRPDTQLEEHVHIGNFVETKKAHLGKGTKAGHLTYLGDAVIGENCNIGAGTITCNYDGVKKHETRMGNDVFIGSDTQLVAPVTLGNDVYVGAGSTITKDIPTDTLAFSRPPLVMKEGWPSRRKRLRSAK